MYKRYLMICFFTGLTALLTACSLATSTGQSQQPVSAINGSQVTATPAITSSQFLTTENAAVVNWSTYINPANGVQFQYPVEWQIVTSAPGTPLDQNVFGFILRPPATADIDPFMEQISASAMVVTQTAESSLYPQAGESTLGTGNGAPMVYTVWSQDRIIHDLLWHLHIADIRSATAPWDDLAYLAEKGAIVQGGFVAVHYNANQQLALTFGQELDREMLIALNAQGGDAIFPTYVSTLAGILETVTFAPGTTQVLPDNTTHEPDPPSTTDRWQGVPTSVGPAEKATYPQLWQLQYDPALWQQDSNGNLVYTAAPSCWMMAIGGKGIPPNLTHDEITLPYAGGLYTGVLVKRDDTPISASYCTPISDSLTCFDMNFDENPDRCQQAAEQVLGTLTTVARTP